jgi:putative phosphonate metabolism protein
MNAESAPPAPRPRYALYYAPRPEDGLATAACQWLGRNPETGQTRAVRPVRGFHPERLAEIVAEPCLYGFHGTLKAPMALADELSEGELVDAVGRFAVGQRAFAVPAVELTEISDFLALVPATRCAELQDLADLCVVEFDEFRRPAEEAEVARRRAAGVTPRQEVLLSRWGYPYVLDEWRFHLTLTGRLRDEKERAAVRVVLQQHFAGALERPLPINDLCIFRQPAPGRAFNVLARFRLGGGRRVRTETWPAP